MLAFGVLPVGYSDLTLLELTGREGFVEESPMTSMRLWRHERRVHAAEPGTSRLVDRLTFEPVIAPRLAARVVRWIFEHATPCSARTSAALEPEKRRILRIAAREAE